MSETKIYVLVDDAGTVRDVHMTEAVLTEFATNMNRSRAIEQVLTNLGGATILSTILTAVRATDRKSLMSNDALNKLLTLLSVTEEQIDDAEASLSARCTVQAQSITPSA